MSNETATSTAAKISKEEFKATVLNDYKLAYMSRETSYLGRKEVLTGKAKFGIFGDGKELPQIALAKQFKDGDFRSGYYRDQTLMMAIGQLTIQEFFAQLYAHTDVEAEPCSAGRSMNGHFGTRSLNPDGTWKDLTKIKNSSADISPTAGQMSRLVGLAQASKVYRNNKELTSFTNFSNKGNEVAFGTIGDASTSEGPFWEAINAIGVLQVPVVMSVWDDGHGISVPQKYQTTKENISEILKGFQRDKGKNNGYEIFKVKAWDYPALVETYEKAVKIAREEHCPVLVHVVEVTQPQGHSTSGSHERYKSEERLAWETAYCCVRKFREWIESNNIATKEELDTLEKEGKKEVSTQKRAAWEAYLNPIKKERDEVVAMLTSLADESANKAFISPMIAALKSNTEPIRKDTVSTVKKVLRMVRLESMASKNTLISWLDSAAKANYDRYNSTLLSEFPSSPMRVTEVKAELTDQKEDGRVVLRENFDKLLATYPEILIFGEDSGKIGGVNQGLEGLQEKYGEIRVSDTGIRENTIIGQGIGMAMRGLRPIAEIQYLDYLLYAIQVLSDDLATLQYRTKGGQKAPLIIRTRGHRLEGIWHSGSPMGMIINSVRGMHVCVPRNLTQAAGFYNTLLQGDDPAIVIEPLNGYRTKEHIPSNLGEFTTPLGIPEVLSEGTDITIVSYGSTCNLVLQAVQQLAEVEISVELIDVRTLLPFDINHTIVESLKKTNRLLIVDEDVPGGASAFILQQIMEEQKGYYHLDSEPTTLTAKAHRPAYGTDGDYFSKPSVEDVFDVAYGIMNEVNPEKYPAIY
ncbi:MAG: thiamine pyrophosphate-dependent enzyme [Flavobacteriales bacterium]|nr:thiamine pyrophosphate-dependent enzyme [Flavobacteriales bacterium]MCW8912349.1 thiamine pyrophosphate-dependent enzyme [Flavobacteriales bacterium]MCW8938578.1 thiamine pyrophosphate-dependent enzyme [Flavobacteriales bacterium]MCW8967499.1 thiamine pyrophosphate-dependent enzyme [Flavobacteriales bacterium]MCW8989488.1 thiamine pyrophosphate-dependent enzyme [Flavobacteriales bacterium]